MIVTAKNAEGQHCRVGVTTWAWPFQLHVNSEHIVVDTVDDIMRELSRRGFTDIRVSRSPYFDD